MPEEATIVHPVLLIRVNRLFRPEMSPSELYEITRGVWRLGERRERVQFAMAVYDGIVREVYAVDSWHRANTTPYKTRVQELSDRDLQGRFEFQGSLAPETIRTLYKGKSVKTYFQQGQQNPVSYINC